MISSNKKLWGKRNRRFSLTKMHLSGINGIHFVIISVCSSQERSCVPASYRAAPWTVPLGSRLMPTTARSVSAAHGLRNANPLYVTSTVPLDTCTYSYFECIFNNLHAYWKYAKSRNMELCLLRRKTEENVWK